MLKIKINALQISDLKRNDCQTCLASLACLVSLACQACLASQAQQACQASLAC